MDAGARWLLQIVALLCLVGVLKHVRRTAPCSQDAFQPGCRAAAPAAPPPPPCSVDGGEDGLRWQEDFLQGRSAFREYIAAGVTDQSDVIPSLAPLSHHPPLPRAARPLRIYRDRSTGLSIVLGLMQSTSGDLLCPALYAFMSLGWPVNLIGPALADVKNEAPVSSLHNRTELHKLMPGGLISGLHLLVAERWVTRKLFVLADMAHQAPADAVLLLVDAGDVVPLLPPSEFAAAWVRWRAAHGDGVVRGADVECYPFTGSATATTDDYQCGGLWQKTYQLDGSPCALMPAGRGVNGGLLAGTGADVAAYFDSVAGFIRTAPRVCLIPEEQAILLVHLLARRGALKCKGCTAAGPRVLLDHNSSLFGCLVQTSAGWVSDRLETHNCSAEGTLSYRMGDATPSLVHFSGRYKMIQSSEAFKLGSGAGIAGYWGPLGRGTEGAAEILAGSTARRELSVDGSPRALGSLCTPPTRWKKSCLLPGQRWEHADFPQYRTRPQPVRRIRVRPRALR
eukprot:TRINITY_DN21231_c0_g1_i1.p1 TRINITY_DN21231_c0_g1~~TRINITY_DN21231_c0_g1_i1.p1  ORF type:complete len:524 (+),score=108.18 TRINITY_DN21231_c0_g1_i1:47-1573(+)